MEQISTILWTDVVTAIAAGLTVLIIFAALLYARHEIKCMERAREAQILTDLSRRWNEEQLTESRKAARKYKDGAKLKEAVQKLRESSDKEYYDLLRLPDFFEALGVLVSSSCLSKQLTKDLFGTVVKYYYDLYSPAIQYLRKIHGDKNIYIWFDDLVEKLSKLN